MENLPTLTIINHHLSPLTIINHHVFLFHILNAVCSDASFSTPIHRSMTPIPQSMKANIWKNIKDIFSGTNHRKSVHKEILFLKTCETLQQPWCQCGQVPEDDVYDKL